MLTPNELNQKLLKDYSSLIDIKQYIEIFKNNEGKEIDTSFMDQFLEWTETRDFIIDAGIYLKKYGVGTTSDNKKIKERIDTNDLVENEDYKIEKIKVGKTYKYQYLLTPKAFKLLLIKAQKFPGQEINPRVYANYYLLLEECVNYYHKYQLTFKDLALSKVVITRTINPVKKSQHHHCVILYRNNWCEDRNEISNKDIYIIRAQQGYAKRQMQKKLTDKYKVLYEFYTANPVDLVVNIKSEIKNIPKKMNKENAIKRGELREEIKRANRGLPKTDSDYRHYSKEVYDKKIGNVTWEQLKIKFQPNGINYDKRSIIPFDTIHDIIRDNMNKINDIEFIQSNEDSFDT